MTNRTVNIIRARNIREAWKKFRAVYLIRGSDVPKLEKGFEKECIVGYQFQDGLWLDEITAITEGR
jgi:hypothetical protein